MRTSKIIAVAAATAGLLSSSVALAAGQTRAASSVPAVKKAPTAGVRAASRLTRVSGQDPVEGGATGGVPTGTIVVVGGLALVATAAGIWAAVDSDDEPDSPG